MVRGHGGGAVWKLGWAPLFFWGTRVPVDHRHSTHMLIFMIASLSSIGQCRLVLLMGGGGTDSQKCYFTLKIPMLFFYCVLN